MHGCGDSSYDLTLEMRCFFSSLIFMKYGCWDSSRQDGKTLFFFFMLNTHLITMPIVKKKKAMINGLRVSKHLSTDWHVDIFFTFWYFALIITALIPSSQLKKVPRGTAGKSWIASIVNDWWVTIAEISVWCQRKLISFTTYLNFGIC